MPIPEQHVGMDNITQGHLDALQSQIEQTQKAVTSVRQQLNACQRRILLNRVSLGYLIIARFVRSEALAILGLRWAVVALGATLTWAVLTVVSLSFLVGFCGALLGAAFFCCLTYLPNSDGLTSGMSSREEFGKALITQRMQLCESLSQGAAHLKSLNSRYAQWSDWLKQRLYRESIDRRRRELANSDWKSLQGNDFQHFLAQAFRLLYYEVQETGQAGDHGVDLIVSRQEHRIAIQAKGYASGNHVDNKAVQEAYSGKDIWQCQACAVITNSQYTRQAREDAVRLGCVMIDEHTLRAFIVGQRDLLQECIAARCVGRQPFPNQNR